MTTLYYIVCFSGAWTLSKWCMKLFDLLDGTTKKKVRN